MSHITGLDTTALNFPLRIQLSMNEVSLCVGRHNTKFCTGFLVKETGSSVKKNTNCILRIDSVLSFIE